MFLWLAACRHVPPPPPAAPAAAPEPSAEARAFFLRAEAAVVRGETEDAIRAAAWLPRLDGADPWAWVHAADLQLRAGRPDLARTSAAEALTRAPELPEAHRVAGLAALASGDLAAAAAHLERAPGLPGVDEALAAARSGP